MPTTPGCPSRRTRVLLYSHDTQGLGHVRRNLEIARALVEAAPQQTDVLVVTGAPEAGSLPRPDHTDLVVLPPVSKNVRGEYSAATLDVSLEEILQLRGALVASAVATFRPDLMIVDKEARGLRGELDHALSVARATRGAATGRRTRLVLGLRDVLDTPRSVRREWIRGRTVPTLRQYYDQVWVYGDQAVHDPTAGLSLPQDVLDAVRFTGYLAEGRGRPNPALTEFSATRRPYVLCLVGGGQDGRQLAQNFVEAPLPEGHHGILVAGPYMPDEVRAGLQQREDLTVLGFVPDTAPLITAAGAVVTMGGYNSVCEVLAAGRPGLIVPRVRPRQEQAIRAEAMAARTQLDCLLPEQLSPTSLGAWTREAVRRGTARHELDLQGLQRVPQLAAELLSIAPTRNSKEYADVIA
ncbi:membrane protein [Kineosporia sp. NBRC 101677]|uniref:glycosyltransferase family protein n=1 Tax=Kineosporia sp. NBRC 101677 TaxID=3032197 RepID=UPI0024A34401|nr:glycosyltransferase [Kineosporia sp. NBRC 101677]GLY16979.1 membrane protein [Kineosporia sp. NBRC 101677]